MYRPHPCMPRVRARLRAFYACSFVHLQGAYDALTAWLKREHPEIDIPANLAPATDGGSGGGGGGGGGRKAARRPRRPSQVDAASAGDDEDDNGDDDEQFAVGKSSTEKVGWLTWPRCWEAPPYAYCTTCMWQPHPSVVLCDVLAEVGVPRVVRVVALVGHTHTHSPTHHARSCVSTLTSYWSCRPFERHCKTAWPASKGSSPMRKPSRRS